MRGCFPYPKNKTRSSVDMGLLIEAHGLVTDMLTDPSLPPHIISGLRAVATLLNPSIPTSSYVPINKSNLINISPFGNGETIQSYTGEKHLLNKTRGRRNIKQNMARRMSASTWSTTTSATGMPTLEPEPSRKRSTNFRCKTGLSSSNLPNIGFKDLLSQKGRSYSTTALPSGALSQLRSSKKLISYLKSPLEGKTQFKLNTNKKSDLNDLTQQFKSQQIFKNPLPRLNLTSDYDSSPGSENEDHCSFCGKPTTTAKLSSNQSQSTASQRWPNIDPPPPLDVPNNNTLTIDNCIYDLSSLDKDSLLIMINIWDYPIFELSDKYGDSILSKLSYHIFKETGLLEAFKIPITEFLNYFRALELGYRDKPYHNRIHAADVLHGVYYLTSQPIPGFAQIPLNSNESPLQKTCVGPLPKSYVQHISACDRNYGIMGANFPALEIMALYTASAMHDYDHPGRTNAFLVSTFSPQAILYNDRSVLENHHAASAWSLFISKSEYNWLRSLDKAEFKRFRFLVIEFILATDLKRHFEILTEFNAKVNEDESTGIDWFSETDRLLVMEMCIKLADINGPCKEHNLHIAWTNRIAEEFYEQGDEEKALGLPISPYMNRKYPQLAKLQESFINHLVAPLCNSYYEAGLLPGIEIQDRERRKSSEKKLDHKKNNSCHKIICLQIEHLRENYDFWMKILKNESGQEPIPLNQRLQDIVETEEVSSYEGSPKHTIEKQEKSEDNEDNNSKNSKNSNEDKYANIEKSFYSSASSLSSPKNSSKHKKSLQAFSKCIDKC